MKIWKLIQLFFDITLSFIEIIMGFAYLLRLLGANADVKSVILISKAGTFFAKPFLFLPTTQIASAFLIDISLLLGMIFYGLVYLLLLEAIKYTYSWVRTSN